MSSSLSGENVSLRAEINGEGSINQYYQQTIINFAAYAGIDSQNLASYREAYNFLEIISSNLLMSRVFRVLHNGNVFGAVLSYPDSVAASPTTRRQGAEPLTKYTAAVETLQQLLANDMALLPKNEHLNSTPGKIAIELEILKDAMKNNTLNPKLKQLAIQNFKDRCRNLTQTTSDYFKAGMLVVAAAAGAVIGGVVGSLFPVAGSMVGLAVGGVAGATAAGLLLFRRNELEAKIADVIEKAQSAYVIK